MDKAQQQIVEALKSTSNILVTVSADPSVDDLSAAMGLTLLLDRLDKRATAIFSGVIPPAINFLEPDKTFESTADSLRDFIIALNKEKADHLRYKVDGDVVKIFITPYKTTLTQNDLEFSQGDYNVELIVALGVTNQDNLDKALDAHGKILHDAKVVTITAGETPSDLGGISWHDGASSSLSEMIVALSESLSDGEKLLDEQIATAFLTGIVSATDRFSNDHTSSRVMTMAAQLMAAGANQQLIAAKLEEGHDIPPGPVKSEVQDQNTSGASESNPAEFVIERGEEKSVAQDQKPVDSTGKSEATLDQIEKQVIESQQTSVAQETPQVAQPQQQIVDQSNEDEKQVELEKELASIAEPNPNSTLADIEKELKQETVVEEASGEGSLVASKDVSMPGFETTEPVQPGVAADATIQPASVPEVPQETKGVVPEVPKSDLPTLPGIVTDHAISEVGTAENVPSPINGVQIEENTGGGVVNPFDVPETPHVGISINPVRSGTGGGTSEGAAMLATPPVQPTAMTVPSVPLSPSLPGQSNTEPAISVSPALPPAQQAVAEVPVLPPLPPLPSLPSDGSTPPLPPLPPSPPVFGGQVSPTMPSGAVSGDVFGDGRDSSIPPTPSTNEPGVFKIPGQ